MHCLYGACIGNLGKSIAHAVTKPLVLLTHPSSAPSLKDEGMDTHMPFYSVRSPH